MSEPKFPGPMALWLLDDAPLRAGRDDNLWNSLDWNSAYIDFGGSLFGPGPYWHVGHTDQSFHDRCVHRLYPRIPAKFMPILWRALADTLKPCAAAHRAYQKKNQ